MIILWKIAPFSQSSRLPNIQPRIPRSFVLAFINPLSCFRTHTSCYQHTSLVYIYPRQLLTSFLSSIQTTFVPNLHCFSQSFILPILSCLFSALLSAIKDLESRIFSFSSHCVSNANLFWHRPVSICIWASFKEPVVRGWQHKKLSCPLCPFWLSLSLNITRLNLIWYQNVFSKSLTYTI